MAPSLALWAGASSNAAVALSMAAMFGVLSVPLSIALRQVALTRLAQPSPLDEKRRLAQDFLAATACAGGAFIGVLAVSGDRLVEVWLGSQFSSYSTLGRWAVVAVGLQYFTYTLCGSLDAADPTHQRPRAQLIPAELFLVRARITVARHAGWPRIVASQWVPA